LYAETSSGEPGQLEKCGSQKHPKCCLCLQLLPSDKEKRRGVWPHARHHPRCPSAVVVTVTTTTTTIVVAQTQQKRKESPAGEQQQAVAVIRSTQIVTQHHFPTYGSLATRGGRAETVACRSMLQLIHSGELRWWERKRDTFWQHDLSLSLRCSFQDAHRVALIGAFVAAARRMLAAAGDDPSQFDFAAIKLLGSFFKKGGQHAHLDVQLAAIAAYCRTVLFYCQKTVSTAVCERPLIETQNIFDWTTEQAKERLPLDSLKSEAVDAGDGMLLRGDCVHRALPNPNREPRYVVFLFFVKKGIKPPDTEDQFYIHGVKK
jgi:hypothetical protein